MGASLVAPKFAIVTEFIENGSLYGVLHRNSSCNLNWFIRINITHQISNGCYFLHQQGN